jgi:hypothetical protein
MRIHLKTAEGAKRPTRASYPSTEAARHIASAPVADVMFDQLRYLAAHNGQGCPVDCVDCARLAQVKNSLLQPFLSDSPQGTRGQMASEQAGG